MGLNLPLDGFDVEVHPQRPPALIAVAPHTNIASRLDPGRTETLRKTSSEPSRFTTPRKHSGELLSNVFPCPAKTLPLRCRCVMSKPVLKLHLLIRTVVRCQQRRRLA